MTNSGKYVFSGFLYPAVFLMVTFFLLPSCSYGLHEFFYRPDGVSARSKALVDIAAPSSLPDSYTFFVLADLHYGAGKKRFDENFLARLDSVRGTSEAPRFVLILGDMVEHGTEDEFKDYVSFVRKIKNRCNNIPVYGIVGNHDLYNSGWAHWKKYVEPHIPYYRFKTKSFSWYFIDSANGVLGEGQLKNLIANMETDPAPKFVFSHYALYAGGIPYFVMSDPRERAILIDTFAENNVKMVFCGHYHHGAPPYSYGPFSELVLKGFVDHGTWWEVSIDENNCSFSLQEKNR